MVPVWGPSTTVSSTAVTVTVCAVAKFAGVKVKGLGATVTCVPGFIVIVTLAVGAVVRTTVIVSVAPPSVTLVLPNDCVTVTPAAAGPLDGALGGGAAPVATLLNATSAKPVCEPSPQLLVIVKRTCVAVTAAKLKISALTLPAKATFMNVVG